MKSLKLYLKECGSIPCNTLGMGGLSFPTDTQIGSGDIFQFQIKNIKKKKYEKSKRYNFRTFKT